ncbi:RNA polymerase III transcription factor (TF)IIIC subunit domain-containing protein [Sarocladium implicatum]|nr:RNA polymerase III transcription factor (TF)IIIC subunit domain-containing protein [Sarocladium implicatum]
MASRDEPFAGSAKRATSNPPEDAAPRYQIPGREMGAVELPAVVHDVDRAIRAFGRVPSLAHALDPSRNSIPLYLNPESPFCKPIFSHNARSHNVVLKINVPKRTGRKRKRGSDEPWQGDVEHASENQDLAQPVSSISRIDDPKVLRRKLEDNVGKYHVEAVGTVKQTHRFRGAADFQWNMGKSPFAQSYAQNVLPGNVEQLRKFQFTSGRDAGPHADIIPPPIFTHMGLPFNYFYSQNPYVRHTEDGDTINLTAVKQVGYFISADEPTPQAPQIPPDLTDPRMVEAVAQLEAAFEDRPVWTRRALLNHLGGKLRSWNELKKYINYVAYQFKGGPWRDGVVPYGLDPRTDPKYRIYQTVMFKMPTQARAAKGQTWHSLRRAQMGPSKEYADELSESHIFDGETYHTDGKVWQMCDVTDPMLKELIDHAAVRPSLDASSGWFHGGLWAKIKAIMKTKLVAIQFGRHLTRRDFAATLDAGDMTPVRDGNTAFKIPLPNLRLTYDELTELRGYEPSRNKKHQSRKADYMNPVNNPNKAGASSAGGTEPTLQDEVMAGDDDDDGPDAEGWRTGSDDGQSIAGSSEEEEVEDEDEIFSPPARSPS